MRRDLKQLAEEGRCQKVYGGATRVENVRERPMSARIDQHAGEKLAIARKALPLVGPGQTVYLDMSSTCVQLARLIASSGVGCTVVTPMVDVLVALAGAPGVTTLCCGGTMRADLSGLTGSIALDVVGRFRFDAAFMGAYGMDAEWRGQHVRRRRRRAQGRRHGEGEPGVPAVRVRQVQCVRHVPLREPRRLRRTRL